MRMKMTEQNMNLEAELRASLPDVTETLRNLEKVPAFYAVKMNLYGVSRLAWVGGFSTFDFRHTEPGFYLVFANGKHPDGSLFPPAELAPVGGISEYNILFGGQ